MQEGLDFADLYQYIKKYPTTLTQLFDLNEMKLAAEKMHSFITRENPDLLDPNEKMAIEWFTQYIQESSREMLQNLLKFCTGCASLNFLFNPQISASFTSSEKILPEASACT